jgi:hypothetical protein
VSHDRKLGKRDGIRFAIAWLHKRAEEMNDHHAKLVLNSAAFSLGVYAKKSEVVDVSDSCSDTSSVGK